MFDLKTIELCSSNHKSRLLSTLLAQKQAAHASKMTRLGASAYTAYITF